MDGPDCVTWNAQQLRVVQQLLWDAISQQLYPAERDEIRRALGGRLLDENETLFAEAAALADILGDVQINTAAALARQAICSNPQRSMIETEIRLLVDRLHCSAASTPYGSAAVRQRDPDSLLPRSGQRDKAVLDYVATVAQIAETGGRPPSAALPPRPPTSLSASSRPGTSSRPHTALSASGGTLASRPGTASPTAASTNMMLGINGSRPSTASSTASSAAARYSDGPTVIAGMGDRLCVGGIEAVRETLRGALLDEKAVLLEDVEYLQGLLEAEADLQVRAAAPPPSLSELRDYSSRLAAVVANEEARVEHEVRVSAMFAAADQQHSRPGRLRGIVDASRRPTSASSPSSAAAAAALGTAAAAALAPVAAPPGRRGSGSSAGHAAAAAVHAPGGQPPGGSSVQTLVVVHAEEEDAVVTESASVTAAAGRQPPPHAGSAVRHPRLTPPAAHGAAPPAAAEALPPGTSRAPRAPPEGSTPALPVVVSGRGGGAPLPPVRPGGPAPPSPSQGTRTPASASTAASPARGAPDPASATTSSGSAAAAAPGLQRPSEPSSLLAASPSGRLRPASPSRLLPPGLAPTAAAAAVGLAPPGAGPGPGSLLAGSTLASRPHRDPSPGPLGAAPRPGGATLRPLLSRSGSMGAAPPLPPPPPEGGGGGATPGAAPRSGSGRLGSRGAEPAAASPAAAAAAASAGSALAARLASPSAAEAAEAEAAAAPSVQRRALFGGKGSVVERLEEEVDAVKGGVAAILERYNVRPSTPVGAAGAAGAASAAAAAAVQQQQQPAAAAAERARGPAQRA